MPRSMPLRPAALLPVLLLAVATGCYPADLPAHPPAGTPPVAPTVAHRELIANPSCEELADGVPAGYRWKSDTPVPAEARVEMVAEAHGGVRAIAVTRLNEAGEYYVYPPFTAIAAGPEPRHFVFSAWLRSESQMPLEVKLQSANAAWSAGWHHLVEVHRGWKRHRLLVRLEAGRDLTFLRVALRPGLAGDRLLIDDLSLCEVGVEEYQRLEEEQRLADRIAWPAATVPAKDLPGRNLLRNPSFETGLQHWGLSYTMSARPHAERLTWCADAPRLGAHSLRYTAGRRWYDAGMRLQAAPVAVEPGRTYTFSAWLRADRPGTEAGLEVRYHAQKSAAIQRSFAVGTQWSRHSLSFTVGECPAGTAVVGLTNPSAWLKKEDLSGRSLWVDGVQLEEGGLSEAAAAPEVAAVAEAPQALFTSGSPVLLRARISASPAPADPGPWTLDCAFEDHAGRLAGARSYPVAPAALAEQAIVWESPPAGGFCAHLTLRSGEVVLARGRSAFAVLPAMPGEQTRRAGLFGLNTATADAFLAVARRMGAGSLRLHDDSYFRWAMLRQDRDDPYAWEPEKERVLAAMHAAGFHVAANLELGSMWASTAPPAVAGWARISHPPRLDEWRGFARDLVAHAGPLVDAWEVWNEPYLQDWWQGTPAQYVELLQATCAEIRRLEPAKTVVGICGQGYARGWNADCLALGAASAMDVFSYHEYVSAQAAPVITQLGTIAEQRRKLTAAAGRDLPMWNSECGVGEGHDSWYRPQPGGARRSPALLVQAYATAQAAGLERLYWYWLNEDLGPAQTGGLGMLEYDGTPKPVIPAFAACARQLAGRTFVRSLDLGPGLSCLLFAGGEGPLAVAWNALAAAPARLAIPSAAGRICDLMGNPLAVADGGGGGTAVMLGGDPVYVLGGGGVEDLAAALGARP